MATWLYQLGQSHWSLNNYRLDIWEGERWRGDVGKIEGSDSNPQPGDIVLFFYAKTNCKEPGFYGWAIVMLWSIETDSQKRFTFRPVAPSDQLKMSPWGNEAAMQIANRVRINRNQATLYFVEPKLAGEIAAGINTWVATKTKE